MVMKAKSWTSKPTYATSEERGLATGFRSGLEAAVNRDLSSRGVPFLYEGMVMCYVTPATPHKYSPDWVFTAPDGSFCPIVIESKGRFLSEDRSKHLLIKAQNPDWEVRFLYSNAQARINKNSRTTYAAWCEKHGFKWAHRKVPEEWVQEIMGWRKERMR